MHVLRYLSNNVVLQALRDVVVPPPLTVRHSCLAAVGVLLTLGHASFFGLLPLLPGQGGIQHLQGRRGPGQVAVVFRREGKEGVGGEQEGQKEVGKDGKRNQHPLLLPAQSQHHHLPRWRQRGRAGDGGGGRGRGGPHG